MQFCLPISSVSFQCRKFHLLAVLAVASLCACSSGPKPVAPVPLSITVQATAKINPDNYARPSPAKVVFYELKSSTVFETADFFSLAQKDQASLGADLLGKEEFFLRPGESKTLTRKGYPETGALGVLVEFRDIDKSIWRATATVPAAETPGMFSSFSSANPKKYQILIDQHSVKFIPVTGSSDSAPTTAPPATTPAMKKLAVPN